MLAFGARRWLLTHGDALCLADTAYMAFRAQMRTPAAEAALLARSLPERQALGTQMRAGSIEQQRGQSDYADVDTAAACAWLDAARADALIHGHTHRPAEHALPADAQGQPRQRWVLSDWDAAAHPPRAQALRLYADGRAERRDWLRTPPAA